MLVIVASLGAELNLSDDEYQRLKVFSTFGIDRIRDPDLYSVRCCVSHVHDTVMGKIRIAFIGSFVSYWL